MAFQQAITPNPDVPCTPGWCLTYVDDAFNLEAHGKTKNYPTAISAWNASRSQHRDHNFPANCWVPIWFTIKGVPAGHVAILAPDGAVWSSSHPTSNEPVRHSSLDAIIRYYGSLGLTFIGWTEDVGGVQVIKQQVAAESAPKKEEIVMVDEAGLNVLYKFYLAQPISEYGYKHRLGKQTFAQAQKEIMESDAAKALVKKRAEEQTGFINHLPDMYKAVIKLPEQLVDTSSSAKEEK